MLTRNPVLDLPQTEDVRLWYYPAVGVEWGNSEAKGNLVPLIAKLLELVVSVSP